MIIRPYRLFATDIDTEGPIVTSRPAGTKGLAGNSIVSRRENAQHQ